MIDPYILGLTMIGLFGLFLATMAVRAEHQIGFLEALKRLFLGPLGPRDEK